MKNILSCIFLLLSLSACVVPAYAPPPGYAAEYYPDYNYYYGAPYPSYYGTYGYSDWGGGYGSNHEHWGHGYGHRVR